MSQTANGWDEREDKYNDRAWHDVSVSSDYFLLATQAGGACHFKDARRIFQLKVRSGRDLYDISSPALGFAAFTTRDVTVWSGWLRRGGFGQTMRIGAHYDNRKPGQFPFLDQAEKQIGLAL